MISEFPQAVPKIASKRLKTAILGPGAIFDVSPRAKKTKSGQTKKYTHEDISNDAKNIIEVGRIDFRVSAGGTL